MHYLGDVKPKYRSAVIWVFKWLLIQYRASVELARLRTGADVVIFYVAYPGCPLPLILMKLLRKKSTTTYGVATRAIGDAAWRQFTTYTESKAAEAGSIVVMVDPTNTTQACSGCGALVKKELEDRVHSCECGLVLDRDENAAINIFRRGDPSYIQDLISSKSCVVNPILHELHLLWKRSMHQKPLTEVALQKPSCFVNVPTLY
jgi:hypothetical protein